MNEQEKRTVTQMIFIYCRAKHKAEALCEPCKELERYAHTRLEKCSFGTQKPSCEQCPIHCYQKNKKQRIRVVMRYAGPRMLLKHPMMAMKHLLKNARS